jgi:hypothetical protein
VRGGVAPSTASGHLQRLEQAGLIAIESRGRRREAQLAGPRVAEALEALANLGPGDADRPIGLAAVNRKQALREARSCYDHLAGRAGVALADQLLDHGALEDRDGAFVVIDPPYFAARFGFDPAELRTRRPLVRTCVDWTERRPHVAGALGKAILDALIADGTLRRRSDGRALNVTRDFLAGDRRSAAA